MEKRNFTLEQLDSYARTLTASQAKALYESKYNRPYFKEERDDVVDGFMNYTLYLTNPILEKMGLTRKEAYYAYDVMNENINSKNTYAGIKLYTSDRSDYKRLLVQLVKDGYKNIITESIDDRIRIELKTKNKRK